MQYLPSATRGQRSLWLLSNELQHPVPGAAAGQRLPVQTLWARRAALGVPAAQPAGRDSAARRWREWIRSDHTLSSSHKITAPAATGFTRTWTSHTNNLGFTKYPRDEAPQDFDANFHFAFFSLDSVSARSPGGPLWKPDQTCTAGARYCVCLCVCVCVCVCGCGCVSFFCSVAG